MITLGLDPSLRGFGWCVHDSDAEGRDRVIAKGRWKTTSKQIFVERYIELRAHVGRTLDEYPGIQAVGVESPSYGELFSSGLYGLFLVVNEAIYVRRKDVVYFDPLTVKMLAKEDPTIRKGKMFKSDMVDAAKADAGGGRWNADEADAYLIARFAARFWELLEGKISEDDLTPSEHQAFVKIHTFTRGVKKGLTVKLGAAYKENQRFFRFSQLEINHGD